MDGRRFDELARGIAQRTGRRDALKILTGAMAAVVGIFRAGQNEIISVSAAPQADSDATYPESEIGSSRRSQPSRSARNAIAPSTRPTRKGQQLEPAATPVVVLTPTSGKIKTSVTAKLTGFRSSEAITLLWFDGSVSKTVAIGTTSSGGKATITFIAQYATRGYHTVRASGSRGSKADVKFAINPSFTLSPKKQFHGASVKASISGYASHATVLVRFFPTSGTTGTPSQVATVTVSATGTGSVNFTVPNSAALGPHRIEGKEQASGRLASAQLQVIECTAAGDCPTPGNECQKAVCSSGICGAGPQPMGSPVDSQTAGDCLKTVCDGQGDTTTVDDLNDAPNLECFTVTCGQGGQINQTAVAIGTACTNGLCAINGMCVPADDFCTGPEDCPSTGNECTTPSCFLNQCQVVPVAAGTPTATQTAGDCQQTLCDGSGGTVQNNDDGDVPAAPGECHSVACQSGNPSMPPRAVGTPCTGGSCDGAGTCIPADQFCSQASDCGTNSECQTFSCTNNMCGAINIASGTPTVSQITGDCKQTVCDGAGGTSIVNDDADVCIGQNATMICQSGTCVVSMCNVGYQNCDGVTATGCEVHLSDDPNNCNSCGSVCFGANATMICVSGGCQIGQCDPHFSNCDGNLQTGCETDLSSDSNNCGQCNQVCPSGKHCENQMCVD